MDKLPELKVVQSLAASLSKEPEFHSQEEIQKLEIGVTLKFARQFLKQYQEGLSNGAYQYLKQGWANRKTHDTIRILRLTFWYQ